MLLRLFRAEAEKAGFIAEGVDSVTVMSVPLCYITYFAFFSDSKTFLVVVRIVADKTPEHRST